MRAAEKLGAIAVDMEQARLFLAMLGASLTFQTFDESGGKRLILNRILQGNLSQHSSTLARLNDQGAGVFVMVNVGDGKGRKASNVQSVRAYFADLDGAPLAPVQAFPLQPHIIVESSPGRWHAYWLTDGAPLDLFQSMQKAIAQRFGADPKVCDLPRVMRVPGFFHNKSERFLSRLVARHDGPPYSHAAMAEAFGLTLPDKAASAIRRTLPEFILEGDRNETLFNLACGLVRKGHDPAAVNQRLQQTNAKRCRPPLCASEVDTIATNASAYGSQGFDRLPHALTDSVIWSKLPPAACVIVLAFYRRFDGFNNGRLCVPWSDLKGKHGMANSGSFYAHLRRIVNAGILVKTVTSRRTQTGTAPALYAIAGAYKPGSRSAVSAPSADCSDSTIKQITALEGLRGSKASDMRGIQA